MKDFVPRQHPKLVPRSEPLVLQGEPFDMNHLAFWPTQIQVTMADPRMKFVFGKDQQDRDQPESEGVALGQGRPDPRLKKRK